MSSLKANLHINLKDPYYAAIARSMLQSSGDSETFTQFWGHLAIMFGGRSKLGKTSSHTAAIETSSYVISEGGWGVQAIEKFQAEAEEN